LRERIAKYSSLWGWFTLDELKTLKDFEHKIIIDKERGFKCILCNSYPYFLDGYLDDGITPCKITKCTNDKNETYLFSILRQEAIKHIIKLEKEREEAVKLDGHFEAEAGVIKVLDWIKYFFNITEEELK